MREITAMLPVRMVRALRENWALFVGMLMLMTANGLLVTLLTIRGAAIGFSENAIGLMQAGYPLGALAGCLLAPRIVENVGHVRAFAALASLSSIAAIVHLMTADVWTWLGMRLLAGFCFPGLYVVTESWLNAKSDNFSRASLLSVYFVVQTLGASAGQALAGLDDGDGTRLFGLASILISLSLVPLLLSRSPAPAFVAAERLSVSALARISPMSILGTFLNGAAQAAFYVALPLYGLSVGLAPAQATLLLVTGTLAGAAAQFPVGWLSDRVDRRMVVLGLSAVAAAAALARGAGLLDGLVFAWVAMLGASTLPVYSLCVAHANDHLTKGQIVPASGTFVLTLNAGVLAGAFAGPAAISGAGPAGLVWLFFGLAAATGGVALLRRSRSEAPERSGSVAPLSAQGAQGAGLLSPGATED